MTRRRALAAVLLVALSSAPASAETDFLRWHGHEATIGALSDALVAAQLGAEFGRHINSPDRWRALRCEAFRFGAAFGASEGTKRLVHRSRPNGRDRKSFYSAHSQAAALGAGWNTPIGWSLAVSVALARMGAGEHYGTDVTVGLLSGALARKVCHD